VLVRPLDEQLVEGRTLIRDIYGNDSLLLTLRTSRISTSREEHYPLLRGPAGGDRPPRRYPDPYLPRQYVFARMSAISGDITGITRTGTSLPGSRQPAMTRSRALPKLPTGCSTGLRRSIPPSGERGTVRGHGEQCPEPVLTIRDGNVIFINEAGVRLSGYAREEIIGRSVHDFLTESSKKSVLVARQTRTGKNNVSSYETEFIRKDGRIINLITGQLTSITMVRRSPLRFSWTSRSGRMQKKHSGR